MDGEQHNDKIRPLDKNNRTELRDIKFFDVKKKWPRIFNIEHKRKLNFN